MFNFIRRLRRRWRIRWLTQTRDGLVRFGDMNDPGTKWQIEAIGRAIENANTEAARRAD